MPRSRVKGLASLFWAAVMVALASLASAQTRPDHLTIGLLPGESARPSCG